MSNLFKFLQTMLRWLLIWGMLACCVNTYPYLSSSIPNGDRVPHPCREGELWPGVGHQAPEGKNTRNLFGLDFLARELVWDECLCRTDSDGDGRTNGEELGDPNCIFREGDTPEITAGITHPGVCEPVYSPECIEKNQWLTCDPAPPFTCPQVEQPGVQSFEFNIERTDVPDRETTYICQSFRFPEDKSYHVIGNTPNIDNENVMHHIVAYACPDTTEGREVLDRFNKPDDNCGMVPNTCTVVIGLWAVGLRGQCLGDKYGFKVGMDGLAGVILELHWNNPQNVATYTDASGLTFYGSPDIRENDAGSIFIGPQFIPIPPQQSSVKHSSLCPGECTKQWLPTGDSIFIPEIIPHMHYLGVAMTVDIWRAGETEREVILNQPQYEYDDPKVFYFDPPIEIRPGDAIGVTCEFQSEDKDSTDWTYWGDATSDEMCVALTTYYPLNPNVTDCWTFGENYTVCGDVDVLTDPIYSCLGNPAINTDGPAIGINITSVCDINGLECSSECRSYLEWLKRNYGACFTTARNTYLWFAQNSGASSEQDLKFFIQALMSCDERSGLIESDIINNFNHPSCSPPEPDAAVRQAVSTALTILTIGAALLVY